MWFQSVDYLLSRFKEKCCTMADGAVVFGASLNASCLTSRARKVNNNSSSTSVQANMRRKTRQSNRRDIHSRVWSTLWLTQACCVCCTLEQAREHNDSSCFYLNFHARSFFMQFIIVCVSFIQQMHVTRPVYCIALYLPAWIDVWSSWWSCFVIAGCLGEGPGHHCLQQ